MKRVLPADVYDTLELVALAYDGIGADWLYTDWDSPENLRAPLCVLGMAGFATDQECFANPITDALAAVFEPHEWGRNHAIASKNNDAVHAIAGRRFAPQFRVSWEEYTRKLNIVRGE